MLDQATNIFHSKYYLVKNTKPYYLSHYEGLFKIKIDKSGHVLYRTSQKK